MLKSKCKCNMILICLFKDVFENSDIADFKARNIEDSDLLEGSEHVNII